MNRWHVDYTKDDYEREWKEVRRRTLKRDRYQCRVFACTVKGAKNLTVHHILPRDLGGDNNDANLITLCPKHHDEIEVACIRQVTLIEAWEGIDEAPNGLENMTSIILATISEDHTVTSGVGVKNHPRGATKAKRLPRHECRSSTVEGLAILLEGSTLSEVAKNLRYPPQFASTISAIMHRKSGAISAIGEDELRERMGFDSIALEKSKKAAVRTAAVSASQRKLFYAPKTKTMKVIHTKDAYPDNARRCSKTTKGRIDALKVFPQKPDAWLRTALSDFRHNKPISLDREDRMCKALGIASPKRPPRRFYRPCLPVEMGETIKLYGVDVEAVLREYLKEHGYE